MGQRGLAEPVGTAVRRLRGLLLRCCYGAVMICGGGGGVEIRIKSDCYSTHGLVAHKQATRPVIGHFQVPAFGHSRTVSGRHQVQRARERGPPVGLRTSAQS